MSPLDCGCRWNAPTLLNKPSAFDIFHFMLFLWVLSLLFTITHCEAKLFSRSFHKLSSLAFIFFLNSPPTTPLTIYEWIFQTNMYVFFANRYCGRMINGLFLRSGILFTNVQVLRSRDNFTHFLHIWIFSFFLSLTTTLNLQINFCCKFLLRPFVLLKWNYLINCILNSTSIPVCICICIFFKFSLSSITHVTAFIIWPLHLLTFCLLVRFLWLKQKEKYFCYSGNHNWLKFKYGSHTPID